jgi:hypothetical protein
MAYAKLSARSQLGIALRPLSPFAGPSGQPLESELQSPPRFTMRQTDRAAKCSAESSALERSDRSIYGGVEDG